jgi:hypothetical protein
MTTQAGTPATTDANLNPVNATLMATIKAHIPGLHIDPNQVYSLLDVEFPEVLTRQIDGELLTLLGPLYVQATPVGTIVMVTCRGDGTNAQFIRISLTATVQWEMVPGTLKNAAGKFIDAHGNVIGNAINNLNLGTLATAFPNFAGIGAASWDWMYWTTTTGVSITVGPICQPVIECP